jgi:hypothetical protein
MNEVVWKGRVLFGGCDLTLTIGTKGWLSSVKLAEVHMEIKHWISVCFAEEE